MVIPQPRSSYNRSAVVFDTTVHAHAWSKGSTVWTVNVMVD